MADGDDPPPRHNADRTLALIESLRDEAGELDPYRAALAEVALSLADALDGGVSADRMATVARAHMDALRELKPEGSDEPPDADAGLSSPVRDTA